MEGILSAIFLIIIMFFEMIMPIAFFVFIFFIIKKANANKGTTTYSPPPISNNAKIICSKCGYEMAYGNDRCPKCGTSTKGLTPIDTSKKYICEKCKKESYEEIKFCPDCGSNKITIVAEKQNTIPLASEGKVLEKTQYKEYMFNPNEDSVLSSIINEELNKNYETKNKSLRDIEVKRTIMTVIYCIVLLLLTFLYVSYHTNIVLILFLVLVLTLIYIKIISKFGLKKYFIKEVKSRPDEKISYIVASTLSSYGCNKLIGLIVRIILIAVSIGIPFIIFNKPHLVYEKVDNGYNLRYYTLGLVKNDKVLKIPSKYKGKNVVGIRGSVFENVYTLEKVELPETIEEIRSGAFKNCISLKEINIPTKVKKISANTFEGCVSLETIELPETIEEIRGEAFLGCTKLKEINLPSQITEIHGGTFQNCESLESIKIPNGVTRIGGSAFRYCYNLKEVEIPESVKEIGSSAFRETGISDVCISKEAYVNERAFKGTYPSIYYYEDGCKNTETNYGDSYNE